MLTYHLSLGGGFKPSIGTGPALYLWLGGRSGAAVQAGLEILTTGHKIEAWILSAGVAYRF